ncbi:hypothetical protein GF366_04925 [Candidatus Peregrinibacteria bacterium]|nr:hypothetical protein [Candidatus Peregrinibacteria bacterium]
MTNQDNPISQIKKAEEDSQRKIDQSKKELDEGLTNKREELEKKTDEFEKKLKERGTEKLETVKTEAGEVLKSRMATTESQKNKLISEAKGKHEKAAEEIVDSFLTYIKD